MKKAAFHNLGCKVNAYETEAMKQLLMKVGYKIVPFNEIADVYVVNTCSVTNIADRKSRQMLHKAKKLNPNATVVAVGCYAQTAKEKLLDDLSVDLIIGNNKKQDLVVILNDFFKKKENRFYVIDIATTDEYEQLEIATITEHTRAHLKIQDGCNNFCTYCVIPYVRGRIRSRKKENILKEIMTLVERGFQEVVLSGINLSCYRDGDDTLIDVMEEIEKIPGLKRIRLGSMEPDIVTEEFVKRLASLQKFCPHFHLSLQSGCDKILQRMNRHYTTGQYEAVCALLRAYFNDVAITTDIIVGFPDEEDGDFEQTKRFVRQIGFSGIHVFKYSKRDGTVAAGMTHQIDEQTKAQRSEELIHMASRLTREFYSRQIGTQQEVLLEEKTKIQNQNYYTGYTKNYVKIAVKSNNDLIGDIRQVTVTDFITSEIMLATL